MTVKLTPKMKKLIEKRVKAGSYATPEDVVMAGLVALERQDAVENFAPGELQSLVAEGEESIRKYGLLDGEEAFRARRRRRAQRRRKSA
jgi:putative addiction module CopG family antidote